MTNNGSHTLRRTLGFWPLVFYGVGDILGAGIYALVGKIAGLAGTYSWLAFLVALVVAALTGLSYAELGSRFPRSGGEAFFCDRAFGRPALSFLIGWLVLCSGVASMATVARGFAGYVAEFAPNAPQSIVIAGFLAVLAGVNFWGIRQSSTANIACTLIEVTGLLLVIAVGVAWLSTNAPVEPPNVEIDAGGTTWFLIFQGGTIAFFAFIGFEDIVNVSEEVKSPERNVPLAILTASAVAGLIYLLVVIVATSVVSSAELAGSDAPLLLVVRRAAPSIPPSLFTAIALFAIANTALLNGVMASRLMYGMAKENLLPTVLSTVNEKTQTPHVAIVFLLLCTTIFALSGTLIHLAGTTSLLLLVVFFSVNVALIVIKRRLPHAENAFRIPIVVPICGAISTLALMAFVQWPAVNSAAIAIGLGLLLAGANALSQRASTPET